MEEELKKLHCSRNLSSVVHSQNLLSKLMAIKFNKSISLGKNKKYKNYIIDQLEVLYFCLL